MDRKKFLKISVAGSFAVSSFPFNLWARPKRKLNILMLGGTNYVGPHLVRTALERGHNVTLFNRGITNPHLFTRLERLRGNRYPERDNGLSSLKNHRKWDAVIDTWQEAPGCVDLTGKMLSERTERYLYISSIATYRNYREVNMTENGPLLDSGEYMDSFSQDISYSVRKRAAEQAVEKHFGRRGIVLRCTSIQGLNYSSDANEHAGYWGYRFLKGKPLLLPDDDSATFQLIDVKDMARFAIRAIENDLSGAYNMVGPEKPLLLKDYIKKWAELTGNQSRLVWANPAWLLENGIRVFNDIRNWIPLSEPEPGFYQISNQKALANGLTYRPLESTIQDGITSLGKPENIQPPEIGMSLEQEQNLIHLWEKTKP